MSVCGKTLQFQTVVGRPGLLQRHVFELFQSPSRLSARLKTMTTLTVRPLKSFISSGYRCFMKSSRWERHEVVPELHVLG